MTVEGAFDERKGLMSLMMNDHIYNKFYFFKPY